MAFDTSADALTRQEPQRVNTVVMSIAGLPGDDVLQLALESFPLPKTSIGIIEVAHGNEKRKFAGLPSFDDIQVVYKDLLENRVAAVVYAWYQQVYDAKTGKIGWARDYKKEGVCTLYAPDGTNPRTWNLHGIWPSAFDPGDADVQGEDFIRINLTLTVDKVTPGSGMA